MKEQFERKKEREMIEETRDEQTLADKLEELGFRGRLPSQWVPIVSDMCEALVSERDATKILAKELLTMRKREKGEKKGNASAIEILREQTERAAGKDELVESLFRRIDELTDRLEEAKETAERREKKDYVVGESNDVNVNGETVRVLREEVEQQKRMTNRIAAERDHVKRANEQLTMVLESRDTFEAHGDVEGYEIALKASREENKSLREDCERLKATIDALDAQRVDLSDKFKRSHDTLREAETRARAAEDELKEQQQQLLLLQQQQQNGTSSTMRTSFISSELLRGTGKNTDVDRLAKALEVERDRLQQECDALTEALSESEARLQSAINEIEIARASEAKAVREKNAIESLRQQEINKARQLDQSLTDALDDAKSAREETKQHREELRYVAEDLVVMTREQQSVNDDYLRACAERDRAWKDLRHAERALENVEVNSVSTAKELADVAKAYRELEGEHKVAVRELSATSSDNQKLEKALQQTEDGLRLAKERSRVLESENRALSAEARNLERRVSQLTKDLEENSASVGKKGGDFAPDGLGSLSEQLEEVSKTCEDLKRQNERYRKQHADVESEFRTLRNKLEESSEEIDRLKLRAKLESNRAEELEGLLASTRAREYDFSMTTEDDSRRLKLLKERVDALSEDNERLTSRLEASNATNAQLSNELETVRGGTSANAKQTKDSESQTLSAARNLAKSLAHSESVVLEQQRRMREILEETKDLRERVEEAENRAASAASFAKQAENKSKRSAAREVELRAQLQGTFDDLRRAREAAKTFADDNTGYTANDVEFETLKRSLEEALEEKEKLEKDLNSHTRRSNDLGVMLDANAKQMNDLRTHIDRLDALLRERDRDLLEARSRQSELMEEINQSKLFNSKTQFDFEGSEYDINDDTKRDAFEALARSVREPTFEHSPPRVSANKNSEDLELLEELRIENELLRQENDKLSRELDGTEEATEEMHNQLKRISEDYNALAQTLSETLNVAGYD